MTDMTNRENTIATINALASDCYRTAKDKGFWDKQLPVRDGAAKIALMHSELSEALEVMRESYTDEGVAKAVLAEEFADVLIRVLDYCGAAGLPIGEAVVEKMERNKKRPYKHGKAF